MLNVMASEAYPKIFVHIQILSSVFYHRNISTLFQIPNLTLSVNPPLAADFWKQLQKSFSVRFHSWSSTFRIAIAILSQCGKYIYEFCNLVYILI